MDWFLYDSNLSWKSYVKLKETTMRGKMEYVI